MPENNETNRVDLTTYFCCLSCGSIYSKDKAIHTPVSFQCLKNMTDGNFKFELRYCPNCIYGLAHYIACQILGAWSSDSNSHIITDLIDELRHTDSIHPILRQKIDDCLKQLNYMPQGSKMKQAPSTIEEVIQRIDEKKQENKEKTIKKNKFSVSHWLVYMFRRTIKSGQRKNYRNL